MIDIENLHRFTKVSIFNWVRIFPLFIFIFFGATNQVFLQASKHGNLLSKAIQKPCSCTLSQGSFSTSIDFLTGGQTPVSFYNYIGSSATTGLEMSNTALFMLYEGGGESALITIIDMVNDGSGGNATIEYTCMPSSAFVAFSDDGGELTGGPPTITGNFSWSDCCTDGGVIAGVGCGDSFIINPSFGSGVGSIQIVSGTPTAPSYLTLTDLSCPIIINCGGTTCCNNAFEFSGSVQNASCSYSTNGAISLNTQCAGGPTFAWSNGETTKNISGLTPGTYTVTITDAGGCSAVGSYTVGTSSTTPNPSITGASVFCEGENINLGVNGQFSSYIWSNGDFGPSIAVTTPGEYTVTVSNSYGCTGTATTTVLQNPAPDVDITGPVEMCNNEAITLDAGPGYLQYIWSNGVFTQTSTIAAPGTYTVTVFNSNGCIGTDEVVIVTKPAPQPIINGPTLLCAGTPVTLDAGDNFLTYSWSNAASSQSIAVAGGGLYTVTVTNEAGCSGTDEHVIIQNSSDTIRLTERSCNPADTGVFFIPFTNQAGCPSLKIRTISYALADSIVHISQSCMPKDTGIVVQRLKNRFGCDSIDVSIVRYSPSDLTTIALQSCNPQDTGRWQQTFKNKYGCDSTVSRIVRLLPKDTVRLQQKSCVQANVGTKEFHFTNKYGCDSLVVIRTDFALSDTTLLQATTCNAALSGTKEFHFTNSEGCDSLVIKTTTLLPPDTTFLTSQTCFPSDTGQVVRIVKNVSGCDSFLITKTVLLPASLCQLSLELKADTIPCNQTKGFLTLLVPGGTPPYNYTWSSSLGLSGSGVITQAGKVELINGLSPGIYTVSVTDSKGLHSEVNAGLFTPDPLKVSAKISSQYHGYDISCAGGTDGAASVQLLGGGLPPYSYKWANGSTSQSISGLGMGVYVVTVTSAFVCMSVDSVHLVSPMPMDFSVLSEQPDCFANGLGKLELTGLKGGVSPFSISLNNSPGQANAVFDKLQPGNYNIKVTDANGCTKAENAKLNSFTPVQVQLTGDTLLNKGTTLVLTPFLNVNVLAVDSIYWDGLVCGGCFSATVSPEVTTTYTVTVLDTLGCRSVDQMTVFISQNETVTIPNIFSPDGNGSNERFTIFGGEGLLRIDYLSIYDRWGNLMFHATDLPPNDPTVGWDGVTGGQKAVPGVYVYTGSLSMAGGRKQEIRGSITLIK